MSMLTISEVAQRRRDRQTAKLQQVQNEHRAAVAAAAAAGDSLPRTPAALRNMASYASVAQMLPEDLEMAVALLPLPLFEIGVCFQQGWGCAKSPAAATYYFAAAANLGDADAMYEAGYNYLNLAGPGERGRQNKRIAAQYLRAADKAGKKVVGESWIWKRKWGGEEDD
ncbi:hypothetical protein DFJ73DRAFT_591053 [Zopfochytrium polystomum]|nr:hypothetical protein DFJ73DRAFT_591053 [Zopfochytrium polystomum]